MVFDNPVNLIYVGNELVVFVVFVVLHEVIRDWRPLCGVGWMMVVCYVLNVTRGTYEFRWVVWWGVGVRTSYLIGVLEWEIIAWWCGPTQWWGDRIWVNDGLWYDAYLLKYCPIMLEKGRGSSRIPFFDYNLNHNVWINPVLVSTEIGADLWSGDWFIFPIAKMQTLCRYSGGTDLE